MSDRRWPVIIVGAGPVGLTCAALLSRAGIDVLVLEATAERARDLRASTWHPPTLDMIDKLGFAAPLLERGLAAPTWQVRMHPSGERAIFDLSILKDDTRHPYRLQCEQQFYCELVEASLAKSGASCSLRRDATVVGARQTGAQVFVDVRQPDGKVATHECAWLIAADGARSSVREAIGMQLEGSTYPETTILATTTFPFEHHLDDISNINYCWSQDGTFSLLRLPGMWRVSLYAAAGETTEDALRPESIQAKLQGIVATPDPYPVGEARAYRIHQRIAPAYRRGRVLLAGDAAHLNSPSGGMGMNGGLHDAFNLCDKLASVIHGANEAVLDRYERQRRPIAAEQILAQAHQNRTRMQERDPVERRRILAELQAIAASPARAHAYLLRTSMIEGLRQAGAVA